jgi:hypothetical protein
LITKTPTHAPIIAEAAVHSAYSTISRPLSANWRIAIELVNNIMKLDVAAETYALIPNASMNGPRIMPPPIPSIPAAIPAMKDIAGMAMMRRMFHSTSSFQKS